MKRLKIKEPINLATCDNPYSLVLKSMTESYTFYGTVTLSGNFVISATGTVKPGMVCIMVFDSAITAGANTFTVLGTLMNTKMLAAPFVVVAEYTHSKWVVISHNVSLGKPDGTTITETSGVQSVGTIGNTQFSSAGGDKLAWSKVTTTLMVANGDVAANAGIVYSKMAALTASELVGTDGSGVPVSLAVATYPSLAELARVKGLTSAVQAQLTALANTFASYTTTTDLGTLLGSYATTSAMNAAISAALGTSRPLPATNAILTGTTVLGSTAYDQYTLNTAGGTIALTLPKASDFANGHIITVNLAGANSAGSSIATQDSNILYTIANASPATLTGAASGSWYDLMGNGGTGAAGSWRVIRSVII